MPYIHFTDDQKLRANSVDLVEFLRLQGERLIPSGRDKRLASDHSVTVRGNRWYDHAVEQGGGAISFVQHFYNLTYPEAVTRLLGGEQGIIYEPASRQEPEPPKAFELPPANKDMRRVYAYLMKQRLISREVLNTFAKAGLIYESCEHSKDKAKEYHNAIFVGHDEQGVPRHAHKKGLYTEGKRYRGNVTGCDPRYSFHYTGTSSLLYVFEAPIDLLSYITLHPDSWQEHSYVALCGTSEHALLWMLDQNPHIHVVNLCLDHDEAGIEAVGRITEILQGRGSYEVEQELSTHKDWNADLIALHNLPTEPAEEHPQLIAAVPICKRIGEASAKADPQKALYSIPALLQKCKNNLHWGRFDEAADCMEAASVLALAAALREYHQLGNDISPEQGTDILRKQLHPHQNRGSLKNRPDEIAMELQGILSKSKITGIRSREEKEHLADAWMGLAVSCAKVSVRIEADQIKQQKAGEENSVRRQSEGTKPETETTWQKTKDAGQMTGPNLQQGG